MKIKFDYNEVSSETVQLVLDNLYKTYENVEDLQFGSVNLYVTMRSKEDNHLLSVMKNGKEVEWIVKSKPMQKTKKQLRGTIVDDGVEVAYIYEG